MTINNCKELLLQCRYVCTEVRPSIVNLQCDWNFCDKSDEKSQDVVVLRRLKYLDVLTVF